jgi:hypothetical protein
MTHEAVFAILVSRVVESYHFHARSVIFLLRVDENQKPRDHDKIPHQFPVFKKLDKI